VFAVGGKYTVESCQVHPGPGYQGGEPGNEVERRRAAPLEYDVGGTVPVRGLELVTDVAA
jgi:hypothetical protein